MTSIQEDVHFDGGPARGDLIFNILLGFTLIGLPFTIGAVVRALWLRFRITSRRISVTGGWMGKDKTQVVYSQISEVRTVPRGFGAWGDMVLVLKDGARLELRVSGFRVRMRSHTGRRVIRTRRKRGRGRLAA